MTEFGECVACGDKKLESELAGGKCLACCELDDAVGDTVEIPVKSLAKLVSLAETRHPTACNQVAPVYSREVEEKLDVDLHGGES